MAPSLFSKRQSFNDDPNGDWWWSSEGYGVRYAIVAVFFGVVVLGLILSYLHAKRRIRRGLPPLAYHRWLVRKRTPYHQNHFVFYRHHDAGQGAQAHPMNDYYGRQSAQFAQPPPAYNQQWDAPPVYQPPVGASKAAANQNVQAPERFGEGTSAAGVAVPPPSHYPQHNATQ